MPAPYASVRGGEAVAPKKTTTGTPTPGSAGWKAFTEKRWAAHHPYAGTPGVDPVTGQPVMKSIHQVRAEANADAWKSIAAMQKALPSIDTINAPFDQQRAAIAPLVAAHRSWLESVGQYQTRVASALGAVTGQAGQTADSATQGAAGVAGAAPGSLPSTNVTPTQLAGSITQPGTYFGDYLRSLEPSATAQGIGNIGTVNAAQDAATRDLNDKKAAIAAQLPGLQADNFKSGYQMALDQYKSELAAIAEGNKQDQAAANFKETVRYHSGQLGLSEDRNKIADKRASAALSKAGGTTAGDVSGLKAALKYADLMMHPKPTAGTTTTTHGRYGVQYVLPGTTDPNTGVQTGIQRKSFGGKTAEGVRAQVKAFMTKHGKEGWTAAAGNAGHIRPDTSYDTKTPATATGGGASYALRQKAWHYLLVQNRASLHPVSTATLLEMFRTMEGQP